RRRRRGCRGRSGCCPRTRSLWCWRWTAAGWWRRRRCGCRGEARRPVHEAPPAPAVLPRRRPAARRRPGRAPPRPGGLGPRAGGRPGAGALAREPEGPLFHLHKAVRSPVKVARIELLRARGKYFVRSTSADGAVGVAITNERMAYLHPILTQLVIPHFVGKDARDLEPLVDGVYVARSHYRLAAPALC